MDIDDDDVPDIIPPLPQPRSLQVPAMYLQDPPADAEHEIDDVDENSSSSSSDMDMDVEPMVQGDVAEVEIDDTSSTSSNSTTVNEFAPEGQDSEASAADFLSNSEGNIDQVRYRFVHRKSPFFRRTEQLQVDEFGEDEQQMVEHRPGYSSTTALDDPEIDLPSKVSYTPKPKRIKRIVKKVVVTVAMKKRRGEHSGYSSNSTSSNSSPRRDLGGNGRRSRPRERTARSPGFHRRLSEMARIRTRARDRQQAHQNPLVLQVQQHQDQPSLLWRAKEAIIEFLCPQDPPPEPRSWLREIGEIVKIEIVILISFLIVTWVLPNAVNKVLVILDLDEPFGSTGTRSD